MRACNIATSQTDKQAFLAMLLQCYCNIVCCCVDEASKPAYGRSICCTGPLLLSSVPCSCSSVCTAGCTHNMQGACFLSCGQSCCDTLLTSLVPICLYWCCEDTAATLCCHKKRTGSWACLSYFHTGSSSSHLQICRPSVTITKLHHACSYPSMLSIGARKIQLT